MKTKLVIAGLVGVIIVLSVSAIRASAGSSNNEAVPECSNTDLRQTATALKNSGFAADYDAVVEVLNGSPKVTDYPPLLQDISQLQANWWSDLVPTLPNCAYANTVALTGGRMLDELAISTAIGLTVLDEITLKRSGDDLLLRAQYHIKQWTDYQDELLALVGDLGDMIEAS